MRQLTKEIINDVSLETGIAPSYLEKDWYLVEVLCILSRLYSSKEKIVFSGGTSLSKAFNLISRFSEDVDFSVTGLDNSNRSNRSKFRDEIISCINACEMLNVDDTTVKSRDESRYVSFYAEYPKEFNLESALRNNLKVEISFKPVYLPTVKKKIKSFVGQFYDGAPEAVIDCVSPIETAANKFSALLWRVDIKNRSDVKNHMTNDPALIRHLHDLSALYQIICDNADFKMLVAEIYKKDCLRGNKARSLSFNDFVFKTLNTLKSDELYRIEYENFVSTMSYGEQHIEFDEALKNYEQLCNIVTDGFSH